MISQPEFVARRSSFLGAGIEYERSRPAYPTEAINWIVGPGRCQRIVDVGCGPGNLTTQLVELGHEAIGIDPSFRLLERLASKGIGAVRGRAEALPLRTECADTVTVAHAFHWFECQHAVPELRRVLRPEGQIGVLWNLRDETVDWVFRLSTIMGSKEAMKGTLGSRDQLEAEMERKLTYKDAFHSVEQMTFQYQQELTEDRLVALAESRSYIKVLPDESRRAVVAEIRDLCRSHPDLRSGSFMLPYNTVAFRAKFS